MTLFSKEERIVYHAHNWFSYLNRSIGRSITSSTAEQYGRSLSYLCEWLETSDYFPNLSLDQALEIISRDDIVEWQSYQQEKGCSNSTRSGREAAIKEFLTWLTTSEGGNIRSLEDSPWGRSNTLRYTVRKANKKSPKHITKELVISVLSAMHNECERCMFHTQYDTGLRLSELINLKKGDLPSSSIYSNQEFELYPLLVNGNKGRVTGLKTRNTVISRAVLNRIRKYHNSPEYKLATGWRVNDPNKPVFLTSNGKPWASRNASKQFKSAVLRSGIQIEMKSHWLRHGTAYSVLGSDMGKDYEDRMLTIQQMLGHADISTTEIYTQIPPAVLAKLNSEGQKTNRLEEAEAIREATYLPPLKHTEKRGHYRD
ncbi:tyrosine-type recombinase/integrase [Neiella sp. HB171785]|uniref:Tyrosine-type recombinase/integrase n=1 Tax=Neiella litorisoli TaxID=2771431 RepID=A0A8J6UPM5_9GAMM|nr:tyrosine-type recombinase/integrase [Neiella litorisoli]MBD1388862.1 tyrosine-type recombinase/integrase [Neiella litorisoli]